MARLFTAANGDEVNFGDITTFDGINKLSVSLWVKPASLPNFFHIIDKDDGITNGFDVQTNIGATAGSPMLFIANTGVYGYAYTTSSVLSIGTWTHIVTIYDGTQATNSNRIKIYIDGTSRSLTFAGNGNVPTTIGANAIAFRLGGVPVTQGDPKLDGTLAEVALWAGVLINDSEITALSRGISPFYVRNSSLSFYCPVWGLDTTEFDFAGKVSGTISGTSKANHPPMAGSTRNSGVYVPESANPATLIYINSDSIDISWDYVGY